VIVFDEANLAPLVVAIKLPASVWTGDVCKVMKVVHRLEHGCTWLNVRFTLVNKMAHGGMKFSE
jgi:acyl-CoA reductase-like NAD-dependent aldehyde dehydrogenase